MKYDKTDVVYFKPSCITCKRVISELDRLNADLKQRDIFKESLSVSELNKIVKNLGIKPAELLRKRDKKYKELDLDNKKLPDSQIIKLMSENPGLIKRPIIIAKKGNLVGKFDLKEMS